METTQRRAVLLGPLLFSAQAKVSCLRPVGHSLSTRTPPRLRGMIWISRKMAKGGAFTSSVASCVFKTP